MGKSALSFYLYLSLYFSSSSFFGCWEKQKAPFLLYDILLILCWQKDEGEKSEIAPNDRLLGKVKANLEEVKARGAQLIVFADEDAAIQCSDDLQVMNIAAVDSTISPIIFVIPLQLLAYHVAIIKGTDVDKPRNLAKSVTVE